MRDPATQKLLKHKQRDLDTLGDWLLSYYRKLIARHGMRGKAIAGDLPFQWQTDFDYPWMDGWLANQVGKTRERNLLMVIPGKDRSRAVIMADHYDTAYMEDLYYKERGGKLARVAAAGADDNHSATAALMLAAPVFQISPGISWQSAWLAYQAHLANMIWNARADQWNRRPERLHRAGGRRSKDGITIPEIARHPILRGEVRPPRDMRSSLFNTDGQIFSDAGIPVVLFMENYDINRVGYHDTHDNMSNIDLDYGAAVAAIAIESVARAAQAEGL